MGREINGNTVTRQPVHKRREAAGASVRRRTDEAVWLAALDHIPHWNFDITMIDLAKLNVMM